ncbi:hypothetical protein EXW38_11490 [Bacillus mycoides]|nr:hypothetical protein EXW38_11490 [Bacillus mycoides]
MSGDTIHVSCGDMDIRIHKKSPTIFDVLVGNCRTGNGILMCSIEQEKPPYSFYKVVNLQIYSQEKLSIGHPNMLLQLLSNSLQSQEKNSS